MKAGFSGEQQRAGYGWGMEMFVEPKALEGASMEQKLMELAEENGRLQRLVAELLMRNQELRERVGDRFVL